MGLDLRFSGEDYTAPQKTTYQDFKQALDTELKKSAEGFVRIGYLLKVARDTEILKESGYASVTDFAKAEYNLSPDMVSRFMAINDRYAVDGYSDQLEKKYQKYGYAKLTELLTLPAEIAEEIPADLSRREIQQIKSEYREEQKISDMEVYMEGLDDPQEGTTCAQVVRGYYKDHPEDYLKIHAVLQGMKGRNMAAEEAADRILNEWAPSGIQTIITRIPGKGKVMMSIDTAREDVTITNMRTQEKESGTKEMIAAAVSALCGGSDAKEAWSKAFGEAFPEIAPVQKKPDRVKVPKKEEKYTDAGGNTIIPEKNSLGNEGKCPDGTPAAVVPDEVSTGQIIGSGTYKPLTEEQKYNRQQNKLDQESKERLREIKEENDRLPSEQAPVVHEIKLASLFYDDVASGRKTFELRKNDRGYKVGHWLSMNEYTGGEYTGRTIEAEIVYMLEDYTGLEDGYCILGIRVSGEIIEPAAGARNAPE